ncbi:MAG: hypothetical protein ACOVP8_08525, partial [Phycisphaerales bacterium]
MLARLALLALVLLTLVACSAPRAGTPHPRRGDEIMIAGQLFHTGGARVKLWFDEGGYDAYRIERRFAKWPEANWEATQKSGKLKQPEEAANLLKQALDSANQIQDDYSKASSLSAIAKAIGKLN